MVLNNSMNLIRMNPSVLRRHVSIKGYSLVEVTVAMSLLLVGVAASAVMVSTGARIEEINGKKARAIATGEAAARLYQLGLSEAAIKSILPDVAPIDPTKPNSAPVLLDMVTGFGTIASSSADVPVPSVEKMKLTIKAQVGGSATQPYTALPEMLVLRKAIP
jgi:anti-sigma factor RsiW